MTRTTPTQCVHDVPLSQPCTACQPTTNSSATQCLHGVTMARQCPGCAVHFAPVVKGAKARQCGCPLPAKARRTR